MGRYICRIVLFALIAGLGWSAARAEDWAVVAASQGADEYDMDLGSVSRTGAFVHAWVREIPATPPVDPATRQSLVRDLAAWDFDCTGRRYLMGEQLHYAAQGKVVSREPARPDWAEVVPGSIGSALLDVACRATEPFADKPLLDDIFAGQWVNLGPSPDGTRSLSLRLDGVVKLDDEDVVFITRSDETSFEVIGGFAIKYNVSAYVLNCRTPKVAFLAADAYWTPHARAIAQRVAARDAAMGPIPPGSYVAHYYSQICSAAAAAPPPNQTGDEGDSQKIGLGTAWITGKGYLITASHVIKDGQRIGVFRDGELVGMASVVEDDPANDIAILKLERKRPIALRALALAAHSPPLGRSVFALGFPEPTVQGQQVKMTAGQVSSTAGEHDDARFLQISAPLQPGNSGGPVIAWDGTVVGIADKGISAFDDAPAQNVNYAIKTSYVRAMLDDLPDLGGYTYVKATGDHDALVAAARKAVFMLVVTQ